jgi:hypothetical protein
MLCVLFRKADYERIAGGEITVAFRRWRRPAVRAGGTQVTPVGVIAFTSAEPVDPAAISEADARRAGYRSSAEVVAELDRRRDGEPYRIEFRLAGPDPRIALRERDALGDDDVAELRARLDRLDRHQGPWTERVLALIERRPAVRAADLAAEIGWERQPFKLAVRKLKNLGLTESLEVGYRLSPRGRALLDRLRPAARSSRRAPPAGRPRARRSPPA